MSWKRRGLWWWAAGSDSNRVNGNLELSRALGDFVFKKNDAKRAEEQIVTAYPYVDVKELTSNHEFIGVRRHLGRVEQ